MKFALTGKGGVGKTTLAALLARAFADKGLPVMAVDADPSPCLAEAIGLPDDLRSRLRPIVEMEELIEERTGAKPGASGGFFTLNPRVDDIPERFSVSHDGIKLLEMGAITSGGSGCICPESAMLKSLMTHLLFRENEVLVMDMYAGVEHLGRSTVDFVDVMLIVAEPTRRSLSTAKQIKGLAQDIGLHRLWLVANKIRDPGEVKFVEAHSPGLPLLGWMPLDSGVQEADRLGTAVYEGAPALREIADDLASRLLPLRETL